MKWYITDGRGHVKSFDTHSEAQNFIKEHPDWYELMERKSARDTKDHK